MARHAVCSSSSSCEANSATRCSQVRGQTTVFSRLLTLWVLSAALFAEVVRGRPHYENLANNKTHSWDGPESVPILHRTSHPVSTARLQTLSAIPDPIVYKSKEISGLRNPSASAKCPLDKASIEPCKCSTLAQGIKITCENLKQSSDLVYAARELRTYVTYDTTLVDTRFQIKNEVFESMNFITLTFRKGEVTIRGDKPGDYSLARLIRRKDALQQVNFMQCQVDLGNTTLRGHALEHLELFETTFRNYRDDWFRGLEVNRVRISSPNLEHNIAHQMMGVKRFIYSNSNLNEVRLEMFPQDVKTLRHIDLSSNRLSSLPAGLFNNMNALEEVILKGNCFSTIDDNFKNNWASVRLLNLEANTGMKCENLDWLKSDTYAQVTVKGYCISRDGVVRKIQ